MEQPLFIYTVKIRVLTPHLSCMWKGCIRRATPSLVPRPFLRGRKKRPGTYCWRMRLVPKISVNLDTPRILSVFLNSYPSFYVRILYLCKIASAGEDNFMVWYSMQESSLKRCAFRRWSHSSSCWQHPLETTFRSFPTVLSRYSCVSLAIALSFS